jgi:hypothetical protein
MTDFDDKWLDVDFEQDENYVLGDISTGLFGLNSYESMADVQILNNSEIDEVIEKMDAAGGGADRLVTRIYNQKSEGSCVANATSQSHEIVQARQFGKDKVVHLSAISLYKRIGRSPSSGAMVSDGLKEMKSRGILPLDNEANRTKYQHVMPNTGFRTPYPSGWETTAAMFRGVEAYAVTSTAGLMTALCRHEPVVVGRQGHSICYVRPMRKNGKWVVKYANSWGDWGDEGYGYDTLSQIKQSARWAFVLRSVTLHA